MCKIVKKNPKTQRHPSHNEINVMQDEHAEERLFFHILQLRTGINVISKIEFNIITMVPGRFFTGLLIFFILNASGHLSGKEHLTDGQNPAAGRMDALYQGQQDPVPGNFMLHVRQLYESSIVVLTNHNEVIPLKDLEQGKFAYVELGNTDIFTSRLRDYFEMPVIRPDTGSAAAFASGLPGLNDYDRIIVGISAVTLFEDCNFREVLGDLVSILSARESVIVFFGSPEQLSGWEGIDKVDGLLLAGNNNDLVQDLSAQVLFGGIGASGILTTGAGNLFPAGTGLFTLGGLRLKYTIPEEAGLESAMIEAKLDSIVYTGITAGAFPGCRVLVAIGGKVIVDRAYGYHTYSNRVLVDRNDLYDLASVTKISGPLPLYMKLVDEGRLDVDLPLSYYWDDWKSRMFRRSDKQNLILRDLLAHQAGVVPYINYWEQTIRQGHYRRRWYMPERRDGFSIELNSHLHLRDNFRDRVYRTIRRSDLLSPGEYRYSCLPFIVSPEVITRIDGRPYTEALYEDFFRPLGAVTLRYNPLHHFPSSRIIPTEIDNNFRRQLIHGYVHDEAAAVLGGISGNAGLFSSAGDLAKLLQMYLNGGEYGGRRYLSEDVLQEFSRVQFPRNNNRRGIGFDKPVLDNRDRPPHFAYPARGASDSSFGHSGFTGTFVWMDPEYDLLYIFLSNRVYPSRENNLISKMNIRTGILQIFYDALEEHSYMTPLIK
jgi:CubicO group peptidase (beta-lactamase class C family)